MLSPLIGLLAFVEKLLELVLIGNKLIGKFINMRKNFEKCFNLKRFQSLSEKGACAF